jgi:hypothetical protein
MNPYPSPGVLTLGFGDLHITVQPMPGEASTLRIDTKHSANIDSSLVRTYARPDCSLVREPLPNLPQLWLGNVVVNLLPNHVERARAWCSAYANWLQHADLPERRQGTSEAR